MALELDPKGLAVSSARLPFAEQIAFFRGKLGNLIPTERWTDVWKEAHDKGFMVAGAQKAELLADLAQAVDGAIAEGKSIQWFRENFDATVAKHGWSYRGERNWRTRVIYQTNLSTSYAAGRVAQMRESGLPYWMYKHSDSVLHPRPLHVSWDGLTLPAEHPWFKTHAPPNGWGCKCRIVAVSRTTAKHLGGRITDTPPDDGVMPDGRPKGIDKGWDYMPGDTVTGEIRRQVMERAKSLPAGLANDLGADLRPSDSLETPPIMRVLRDIEGRIAQSEMEHVAVVSRSGEVLLEAEGAPNRVRIPREHLPKLRDAVLIHNHPGWASFSDTDVRTGIVNGVAEIRVVDLGWVYTMRPPRGQIWRRDDWKTTVKPLYDRNFGEVKVQWDAALAAGQIGLDAYQEHFMDEVWRRVAMDSGIRYRRKGRRP